MNSNKSFLPIAWRLTAITVLILLFATFFLANKTHSQADSGFAGYINSSNSTVYLRRQPNLNSHVISVLEENTTVHVNNSLVKNGITWYRIEVENNSGWIPQENLIIP